MKKGLLLALSVIVSLFSVNVFATPMRTIYAGSEETITSQTYNVSTGEMQYYTVESADPQYLVADKIKINGVCASFDNCHHSIDFKVTAISKGSATVYIKDDNGDIVESYFFTIYPGPEMTTIEPENGVYIIAAGDSAYISGYDSGKYSFESSDPSIAVISDTRVLTGIKEGETTIGAYLPNGGGAALINVKVYQSAKSIQISGGNRFYNKQNISEKLEVIFNPTNTTYKDVTWKSANPSIIDITADGYPVVKKNGQANIIACTKRDNVCTSITVTASNIIEEFKVKDESKKINVGETKKVGFETNPTVDFSKKDLKWESADEKIVKVDKDGKITGVSAGKADIIMINNSDSLLVRFEVEVFNPIKSVTPSVKEHTMLVGENFKLSATINPSNTTDNKTLIWDSVDKSIATVDNNGNVKAIKAGMTYLSVTASNGKSAMIKITVKNPIKIEKVSVNKNAIEMAKGTTQKITATITPANTTDSKKIIWSSSNAKIATVDQNGLVKGISNGDAVVTAKFSNGKVLNIKVKVKSPVAIKSIKMKKTKISLAYGNNTTLQVSVSPSNATLENNLTWKSSNNKVVKVDQNGKIAAVGAGSATITVKTSNGKKATVKVTVSKINAKKATITAIKNQTQTGKALKPAVEVKLNGKVLKKGTDYTVTYKNNKKAGKATVTVKFKGNYTGSKTGSFLIVPSKVNIKNPTTTKKSITVKYTKVSGAKTYQVAYRLKGTKKWSYTTKSKISKLTSGKQYEVCVRAGIKSGSKTIYGAWSKTKVIKVK